MCQSTATSSPTEHEPAHEKRVFITKATSEGSGIRAVWPKPSMFTHTIYEPRHVKTNKVNVRPAKTQISLGIRPVWSEWCPGWSESSLCAQWVAKGPRFLHADSEDSDQTGRMHRLIWVFTGRTVILLVLSCRGSYMGLVEASDQEPHL